MQLAVAALVSTLTIASTSDERSGLNRWGLGVELPMIGITTGLADKGRVGWGYNMGAAISYEVTPVVMVRVYGAYAQTYEGEARIGYLEAGEDNQPRQLSDDIKAEWFHAEAGVGAAYLWRGAWRQWDPYIGADVGARFGGYNFVFGEDLKALEATDIGDALARCTGPSCESTVHDAAAFGWLATVRSGVRFQLSSWLATLAELSVSYTPVDGETVSNTVATRQVESAADHVLLVRGTFSIRLGL